MSAGSVRPGVDRVGDDICTRNSENSCMICNRSICEQNRHRLRRSSPGNIKKARSDHVNEVLRRNCESCRMNQLTQRQESCTQVFE